VHAAQRAPELHANGQQSDANQGVGQQGRPRSEDEDLHEAEKRDT
jgi:hypothetical protein